MAAYVSIDRYSHMHSPMIASDGCESTDPEGTGTMTELPGQACGNHESILEDLIEQAKNKRDLESAWIVRLLYEALEREKQRKRRPTASGHLSRKLKSDRAMG